MSSRRSNKQGPTTSDAPTAMTAARKFNKLRQEQRDAANKLAMLETDVTENKLVKEALLQVDGERKCFRSQGGVLIEKKVKDVIPALDQNRESLEKMMESTLKEMTEKGKEIQAFMAQNKISIQK